MIRALAAVGGLAILGSTLTGCSYSASPEAVCLSTLDAAVADFIAADVEESVESADGATLTLRGTYEGGTFECIFSGDPLQFVEGHADTPDGGRTDVLP